MSRLGRLRLPVWVRWVAAWAAAVFLLLVGGSITLLMSQSSGCTTSQFQITGPSGFLSAAGQVFTLSWGKSPSSLTCESEAEVNVTWITPGTATATGTNGSATFTAAANTSTSQRTATITVGSPALVSNSAFEDATTFNVTQSGATSACTYTLSQPSPSNFSASGGTGSVLLSVGGSGSSACPISAPSTSNFITITSTVPTILGPGTSVTITFTVAPNTSSATLTGTLSVAGQTVTITESGASASCSVSISPSSINIGSQAANFASTFSVNVASGCAWTAVSNNTGFLTVVSGQSGSGPGSVNYSVNSPNSSSSTRTGTITVTSSGTTATFTINQVIPLLFVSATAPASGCGAPTSQKYYLQGSSLTIYPWFASAPGTGSDVVTVTVLNSANTAVGATTTLSAGLGCFFAPISLSSLTPGTYTLMFSLNGATAGSLTFAVLGSQLSLSAGALTPLPGSNQETVQVALPGSGLPDPATVTLSTSLTPSGVVNAAASPGSYDCRVVSQSGGSVTIPAGSTQSSTTVSGGTVAGTCSTGLSGVSVPAPGLNYSPTSNTVSITNTPSSSNTPYIASVSQSSAPASGTLTLVVTGYSLTRDLSSITFNFTPASGYSIGSASLTANVQSQAVSWYTSAGSAATGGQFQYTQSFNIGSGTSANLAQVSVSIASSTGSSQPTVISLK